MPALSQEAAKQLLCAAIESMTGQVVYLDHLDSTRPSGDHLQVIVTQDAGVGRAQRSDATTLRQPRVMSVEVHAYGEASIGAGAVSSLGALAGLLLSDDGARRGLSEAGVAIQGVGGIITLTSVIDTAHEPHALLTLRAGYCRTWTSAEGPAATAIVVDVDVEQGATLTIPAAISVTV